MNAVESTKNFEVEAIANTLCRYGVDNQDRTIAEVRLLYPLVSQVTFDAAVSSWRQQHHSQRIAGLSSKVQNLKHKLRQCPSCLDTKEDLETYSALLSSKKKSYQQIFGKEWSLL